MTLLLQQQLHEICFVGLPNRNFSVVNDDLIARNTVEFLKIDREGFVRAYKVCRWQLLQHVCKGTVGGDRFVF